MDEKEIDLKIEKEMVDLFIVSNRKERTLWELEWPFTFLFWNLFKSEFI